MIFSAEPPDSDESTGQEKGGGAMATAKSGSGFVNKSRAAWKKPRVGNPVHDSAGRPCSCCRLCARTPLVKPVADQLPSPPPVQHPSVSNPLGSEAAGVAERLRAASDRWAGTPHRMGGSGSGGMDCSGLTRRIYKELFQIDLPRTTSGQVNAGKPVERTALVPGDLVFFQNSRQKAASRGDLPGPGGICSRLNVTGGDRLKFGKPVLAGILLDREADS